MSDSLDVALLSMPFAQLPAPSLALGILKATLAERGLRSRSYYFTFDFAERIGIQLYTVIAAGFPSVQALAGESVFSHLLPGAIDDDHDGYVRAILHRESDDARTGPAEPLEDCEGFLEGLAYARAQSTRFVREAAERVVASGAPVVGMTSMFQQNAASIALAYEIKRLSPHTFIAIGGANCAASMGEQLLAAYDCFDAVFSGEADWTFPEMVERIRRGVSCAGLPGVHLRGTGNAAPPVMTTDLDALPDSNFDDYFEQLEGRSFASAIQASLYFETSRGCWWGEKAHCTFCGLNGETMAYRRKSPERALSELRRLRARYGARPVFAVDNILDLSYLETFIPAVAEAHLDVELFYEVKSSLTKPQLAALRAANITKILPGIESLSTPVLKAMKKGVTATQNLQLLKWCSELEITATWNMLWGFPGEPPEEYAKVAAMMPLLRHLTPPWFGKQIRMDRFSPNFTLATQFGFANVRPCPAYRYIYRFRDDEALARMAYYFTYDYAEPQHVDRYVRAVADEIEEWLVRHDQEELYFVDEGDALRVVDRRSVAVAPQHTLTGLTRRVLLSCDSAQRLPQLVRHFADEAPAEEVEAAVAALIETRLLLDYDDHLLSLPISKHDRIPIARADERQFSHDCEASLAAPPGTDRSGNAAHPTQR